MSDFEFPENPFYDPSEHHRERVEYIEEEGRKLTRDEVDFLEIVKWQLKEGWPLSEPQERILERIYKHYPDPWHDREES